MDSSTSLFGHVHFLFKEWLVCFLSVLSFIKEILVLDANSVDPDQTPRSVESDLGVVCLPMYLLWDARHKWVKKTFFFFFRIMAVKERR